jgi:SET domain-containing protein
VTNHAPSLEVKRGRRGRGVFAARAFKEGEVIEVCPTVNVPDEDVPEGAVRQYVFGSRQPGKVMLVMGYAMLYNHSSQPNMFHRSAGRQLIEFVALRDIEKGEELTHDYGDEYWEDRGMTPK